MNLSSMKTIRRVCINAIVEATNEILTFTRILEEIEDMMEDDEA